jgi:hypothetical protein
MCLKWLLRKYIFEDEIGLNWHSDESEASGIFETSVNFYQTTQCNNPEDSRLYTLRRESLKHVRKVTWNVRAVHVPVTEGAPCHGKQADKPLPVSALETSTNFGAWSSE